MKKFNMKKMINKTKRGADKNAPFILIAIGVAGMFTAGGLAVSVTPKAMRLIEEEKNRINAELYESAKQEGCEEVGKIDKLKPLEVVKVTWKCYTPAIVLGVSSALCVFKGNSINMQRSAALATAYQISETAYREYKDKVIETIGEKREQVICDKVTQERLDRTPVPVNKKEVINADGGNMLCFDYSSGRYFRSDVNAIRRAESELNRDLNYEMYISLNELYSKLGLEETSLGDELGWNIDDGLIELEFSSKLSKNDEPCLVISYKTAPKYEFNKLTY